MAAGWLTNIPLWFNDCNPVVGAWQNWRNPGSFERRNPMEKIKEGTLDAETIQATNNLTTL
jgi:hypothetical protein